MKDIFSQRIKHYRKEKDLTQEELACAIGISSQSISKWERGDGFPDITLLPVIANFFGITIDELLGNDVISKREDIRSFWDKVYYEKDREERVKLTAEYVNKYPKHNAITRYFIDNIMMLNEEKREKYIPFLKETCIRVIKNNYEQRTREKAIYAMSLVCDDDEVKNWIEICCKVYDNTKMEVLENRLWRQGKREISRAYHDANDLNLLIHYMFRPNRCFDMPERLRDWCITRINIIDSMANEGKIPELWLGAYAILHTHMACAKFGLGEKEEGYSLLEKSLDLFEKWLEIPYDSIFSIGNNGVEILKKGLTFKFPDGSEEYCENLAYLRPWEGHLYGFMTCDEYDISNWEWYNGWEWFDIVRDEERFKENLERAKNMKVRQ